MKNYSVPLEQGMLFNPTIADPSAGSDFSLLLPNNKRYQLTGIRFRLVTDSTSINRHFKLQFLIGGTLKLEIIALIVQPAFLTLDYNGFIGQPAVTATSFAQRVVPLPNNLFLPGGSFIQSLTNDLQSGDQFSNIELLFNTWVERTV